MKDFVFIGDSSLRYKVIKLPKSYGIDANVTFKLCKYEYQDRFDIAVYNDLLIVRRQDLNQGWGYPHKGYIVDDDNNDDNDNDNDDENCKIKKDASNTEKVTIAILVKDKAHVLHEYLNCIYNLDYDKKNIHIYIKTNDNNDDSEAILKEWVDTHGLEYASVHFDGNSVDESIKTYKQHEWDSKRFSVLGKIRQESIDYAISKQSNYFVVDVDNFVNRNTLKKLVETDEDVVGPLLKNLTYSSLYSNYHESTDENGYFAHSKVSDDIYAQKFPGIHNVNVIHCTYYIKHDVLPKVLYLDNTNDYEYVIFSRTLRNNNIIQFIDNREVYGLLTFADTKSDFQTQLEAYKNYNKSFLRFSLFSLLNMSDNSSKTDYKNIFQKVYNSNACMDASLIESEKNKNDCEKNYSTSGLGSCISYNKNTYIPFLRNFVIENDIKSVVDLGCGDFLCGSYIYDGLQVSYVGYDAYEQNIISLRDKYKDAKKFIFEHADFVVEKEKIASADLCIIKDVLQHLTLQHIYEVMDYLTSAKMFKHILVCNSDYQTSDNTDIVAGGFRPLSNKYLPLKRYNGKVAYTYNTKEVILIN